jgi:hypothetical protein
MIDDLLAEIHAGCEALWAPPLYWVPVRHHSPACALALEQLLAEIRPASVLIEGPVDCQALIAACQDKATRPPVALLSQKGEADNLYSAYFPLCEYSPEWIALQYGRRRKVQVRFIDLPYDERPRGEQEERVQSLMAERYLMHSRYLKGIADRLGCRDSHEAWDRLFEQRPPEQVADWRSFFKDVAAYCFLARRDYEPEVVEAAGDGAREAFMAAQVRLAMAQSKGPHVVVTGGFHTAALMALVADEQAAPSAEVTPAATDRSWLIRYSFDQLDALNGYGAGMPAPAYYQMLWQTLNQGGPGHLRRSAAAMLIRIAHDNRKQQLTRRINPAEVQAAVLQAEHLALLRGTPGPGRSEVLDAVTSCFIKDAVHHSVGLLSDARRVMCGDRLGRIPDSALQPPLVRDAWNRGRALGLEFDTSQVKTLSLELHRKGRHRQLSRFLHATAWIGCDLAQWQAGPDFVNGHQLGLMREQWRYAWTPQVESRLLGLVGEGTTIEQVALKRLKAEEQQLQQAGKGGRAGRSAGLLVRACVMGLHRHAADLAGALKQLIDQDQQLPSLVDCAHQLTLLVKGRALLEAEALEPLLTPLIRQCCEGALYLLPALAELEAAAAEEMVPALAALKALLADFDDGRELFWGHLVFLRDRNPCPGLIRGACLGLLFQGGRMTTEALNRRLEVLLMPHQPSEVTVGTLQGLIRIARETLWRVPAVLDRLNQLIDRWPEEHFIKLLPALRLLFTDLSPRETHTLAQRVVEINGWARPEELMRPMDAFTAEELIVLQSMDAYVVEGLTRLNLGQWFEETHADH